MKKLILAAAVVLSVMSCTEDSLYRKAVKDVVAKADEAVKGSTEVPVPVDAVGGPTYDVINDHVDDLDCCGYAYELTRKPVYSKWIDDLLMSYASLYPALGYHPQGFNTQEPGRLFWQVLEEARWAMYASRAYLKVKDRIPADHRDKIENDLFLPMADFLMYGTEDNPKNNFVFNRMHNHGTWQCAAVGMIGLATGNDELVEKALRGTDLSCEHGGLLQQIDLLFSPDGYYMEGVSYQRYALIPFMALGALLEERKPEVEFFQRNSGALLMSADAMFNLAYDGVFFPMNDCDRKTYSSEDLVGTVCALYKLDPSRKWLLSIARDYSKKVTPDAAGKLVSKAISSCKAEQFVPRSCKMTDGGDGKAGAVMVLRGQKTGDHDGPTVTMKACGQGSYHGHFDKLTIGYFDCGNQVLTDYGSARYTGVGQKEGGRYTKLNRGYAMTTVAHNTLVVDRTSHYQGVTPFALPHSPRVIAFDGDDSEGLQYMAAVDSTAYKDCRMERWVAMVTDPELTPNPLVVDIVIATAEGVRQFDLPYHFQGQMMALNADYTRETELSMPMGEGFGYQHLWKEAEATVEDGSAQFTWLLGETMYTLTTAVQSKTDLSLVRAGANDPTFILRPEPAYMIHREGSGRQVFASCLETHGRYRVEDEVFDDLYPTCTGVAVEDSGEQLRLRCEFGDKSITLVVEGSSMSLEN